MLRARKRTAAVLALVATGALLASGCSSSSSKPSSSGSSSGGGGQQVTLKIGLFGTFGYKETGLYDQYMKLHPNIKIVEASVEDEGQYYTTLQTHLSAGSGLDDIQGIEVGRIADVDQNLSSKFVDLNTLGAASLKSNFYPAKWAGRDDLRRQGAWAWAPTSDRWPSATAPTCSRPRACRPTALGQRPVAGLGQLRQDRAAVQGHGPGQPGLDRHRRRHVQRDRRAVGEPVLRQLRQGRSPTATRR